MTRTSRYTFASLALLTALLFFSGCGQRGVVVGTDDGKLTVAGPNGETSVTHELAPDATITRNGQPAALDDLRPGDSVFVTTELKEDGKKVATKIEATSETPQAPQKDASPSAPRPLEPPMTEKPAPTPEENAMPPDTPESQPATPPDEPQPATPDDESAPSDKEQPAVSPDSSPAPETPRLEGESERPSPDESTPDRDNATPSPIEE